MWFVLIISKYYIIFEIICQQSILSISSLDKSKTYKPRHIRKVFLILFYVRKYLLTYTNSIPILC